MSNGEIRLTVNERRLAAVKEILRDSFNDRIEEMFNELYRQTVPFEQREKLEAEIEREEQNAFEKANASRSFAVYLVIENGRNSYFTNENHTSLFSAACRLRLYNRGEPSSQPESFSEAFLESGKISAEDYYRICTGSDNDSRVTALFAFDLDRKIVCVRLNGEYNWRYYRLSDVLEAAERTVVVRRSDHLERSKLFDGELAGKEITREEYEQLVAESMDEQSADEDESNSMTDDEDESPEQSM